MKLRRNQQESKERKTVSFIVILDLSNNFIK